MTIDRRALLSGLLAAPIALNLPVPAGAAVRPVRPLPPSTNPLFSLQRAGRDVEGRSIVHMLGAIHHPHPSDLPKFEIGFQLVPVGAERFRTREAAENVLLALIMQAATLRVTQDGVTYNATRINRCCNLIASRNRRGAGNIVLMHEADFEHIEVTGYSRLEPLDVPPIGRWSAVGVINGRVVWTTDDASMSIPRGFALVGFKGNGVDAGAHVALMPDGRYGIAMVPPQPEPPEAAEPRLSPFEIAHFYSGQAAGPLAPPPPRPRLTPGDILASRSVTSYFGIVELLTPENRRPDFDKNGNRIWYI